MERSPMAMRRLLGRIIVEHLQGSQETLEWLAPRANILFCDGRPEYWSVRQDAD